ncbi:hypothetical protein WL217_12615, partial [Staphylococcus capitis]
IIHIKGNGCFEEIISLGLTQLPTHGFTVRVLSNMTQAIEEILNTVQSYIANKLYDRQIDFLRKY